MPYQILYQPVSNSKQVYTGIRCSACKQTSYSLDDIEAKCCPFCKSTHTTEDEGPSIPFEGYYLMCSSGKKARKVHWTLNGSTALCTNKVSLIVSGDPADFDICTNCEDLKRRGFKR